MTLAKYLLPIFILLALQSCATTATDEVYQKLGGQQKVEEIVDNFITEIEYNEIMFEYFEESDVERFREKLIEHICFLTGGPCKYTGDDIKQVHDGMNITESDFNLSVDLFINAMDKAKIPHPIQNKILAAIAPERKNIIYR